MFKLLQDDIIEILDKNLRGDKPSIVFTDIDGVLTIKRGSYALELDVIRLLRDVEKYDIPICLISGNAYPVVLTLQRYLGLSPIFVAENGCVIQVYKELIVLCKESLDYIVEEIRRDFGLEESSSNRYRLCDRAFHIPAEIRTDPKKVRELEKQIMEKYPNIYALYTGYVLHIYPKYCSKSRGMEIIAEKLYIDLSKSIAIGDSVTDYDMIKTAGIGVVVGDADEEIKRDATIILPYNAGMSTRYFLEQLLSYLKRTKINKLT
ncbi:MAG: phosphoglycolate phosphatase [Desulfurococcaceae archaeon]